ncbi:MAG: hypothetical protein ISR65_02255 [Bacteriovoracaceae bacterium]|nr:hypothetical protein [Bacteriovoracaceae bacterium]
MQAKTKFHVTVLIIFSTIIFINIPTFGSGDPLLRCLGREELTIHQKKMTGPLIYLNRFFINEFSRTDNVKISSKFLKKICETNSDFSPSVNLLRYLLLYGTKIFTKKSRGLNHRSLASVDDISDQIPFIFFNYLSKLQLLAPTASCLSKNIPEFRYFLERFKYLETDIPPSELIADKKRINKIFESLKKFDSIIEKCKSDRKAASTKIKKYLKTKA